MIVKMLITDHETFMEDTNSGAVRYRRVDIPSSLILFPKEVILYSGEVSPYLCDLTAYSHGEMIFNSIIIAPFDKIVAWIYGDNPIEEFN